MTNTTSFEREPLLSPIHTQTTSGGSVVSYTIAQQNCTNVTLKDREEAGSTKRKLWFAVCLACSFFAVELVAGYFANSLGNVADLLPFFFCSRLG
jgi:zinc transporter 2/zinc transporter 4